MVVESEMNEIWQKCGKDFEQKTVEERTKMEEGTKSGRKNKKDMFGSSRTRKMEGKVLFLLITRKILASRKN